MTLNCSPGPTGWSSGAADMLVAASSDVAGFATTSRNISVFVRLLEDATWGGTTVTRKDRVTMLLLASPLLTVTVIVATPTVLRAGARVSVPLVLALV